jgi:hypothetical protein
MSRCETGTGCVYRADCHGNAAGYDRRCAHGSILDDGLSVAFSWMVSVSGWFSSVTRSRAMVSDPSVESGLSKPDLERGIVLHGGLV